MALLPPQLFPSDWNPTWSGHETFVLRGTWLKKSYDLLLRMPTLFSRDDAFVLLGVGKNMAQSMRYWGRVTGMLTRHDNEDGLMATPLGHALFADDGWDPFLVTPTSAWLLHWQIAARAEGSWTWFYTFNLLRSGEWTVASICEQLAGWCAEHEWRQPAPTTLRRDVECMLQCYLRPKARHALAAEDGLACPLADLDLIRQMEGQHAYRLSSTDQPSLPDTLVAFAIHEWVRRSGRRTVSFSELAYAPCSPGRVFRLDEDALLTRLQRLEQTTAGAAYFTDQAGIRQVAWQGAVTDHTGFALLQQAFETEVRRV